MPAPTPTQAAIRRTIEAGRESGGEIIAYTVTKDGTISVTVSKTKIEAQPQSVPSSPKPKSWSMRDRP